MTRGKRYVVFIGLVPGVYGSWSESQRQVIRFPGNSYQSYSTKDEAEEAFEAFRHSELEKFLSALKLEAKNGNRQGTFEGQLQEGSASGAEDKQTTHVPFVIMCSVIICAVVLKLLW